MIVYFGFPFSSQDEEKKTLTEHVTNSEPWKKTLCGSWTSSNGFRGSKMLKGSIGKEDCIIRTSNSTGKHLKLNRIETFFVQEMHSARDSEVARSTSQNQKGWGKKWKWYDLDDDGSSLVCLVG